MLTDPQAIEIISHARQSNVAAADRSDRDIRSIVTDFFAGRSFEGETILELGPGQYDLARCLRERGAEVRCIDNDPPVAELGRYFGFDVTLADLQDPETLEQAEPCHGLFCKFSVNAFWFEDPRQVREYVFKLDSLLKPFGWGWVAPWNGVPKTGPPPAGVRMMLDVQREAFRRRGWHACLLDRRVASRYGITGRVAGNVLFVRNLPLPPSLRGSRICYPLPCRGT